MGMVVRSNIMALNANRQLGMNNSSVSKNLEKLSSGFRINRAGDDASGLAISEKMKAQIKGLETASMNSQDGISLVQTAEGALTEVHDMLNRMVELAEKSANGTMEIGTGYGAAGTDRQALQDEMDQLATEIDRIADSTNFNNIKLLDGSLSGAGNTGTPTGELDATNAAGLGALTDFAFDAAATDTAKTAFNKALGDSGAELSFTVDTTANTLDISGIPTGYDLYYTDSAGNEQKVDGAVSTDTLGGTNPIDLGAATSFTIKDSSGATVGTFGFEAGLAADGTSKVTLSAGAAPAANAGTFTAESAAADTFGITGIDLGDSGATGDVTASYDDGTGVLSVKIGDQTFTSPGTGDAGAINTLSSAAQTITLTDADGKTIDVTLADADTKVGAALGGIADTAIGTVEAGKKAGTGNGLVLQIGDTNDSFNKMTVSVQDMHMASLFDTDAITDAAGNGDAVLQPLADGTTTLDISSQDNAGAALTAIKKVINTVSSQRASLGAIQNRLEHTINNLDVAAENMNAANSRVRDTDMAKQMMEYTKMNVLTQAAQAMLAQANQQPQSILQLLQ